MTDLINVQPAFVHSYFTEPQRHLAGNCGGTRHEATLPHQRLGRQCQATAAILAGDPEALCSAIRPFAGLATSRKYSKADARRPRGARQKAGRSTHSSLQL